MWETISDEDTEEKSIISGMLEQHQLILPQNDFDFIFKNKNFKKLYCKGEKMTQILIFREDDDELVIFFAISSGITGLRNDVQDSIRGHAKMLKELLNTQSKKIVYDDCVGVLNDALVEHTYPEFLDDITKIYQEEGMEFITHEGRYQTEVRLI